MNVGVWCIWIGDRVLGCVGMWCWWWQWGFGYGGGDGVAGVAGREAGLWRRRRRGRREMGVAFVKRLQFLIPNRGAWWTGWDTGDWSSSIMGRGNRERERRERERRRCKNFRWSYLTGGGGGGERENRFPIKASRAAGRMWEWKGTGYCGRASQAWDCFMSPCWGLRGGLAWKWVRLSGTSARSAHWIILRGILAALVFGR